jgi:hypothetical protein
MIESLSQDSINAMPDYVQKWAKIGYDTSPLDPELVTRSVNKMYECGDLPHPKKIVICKGPTEANLVVNMYLYKKDNPKATKKQIIEHVKKNITFHNCGYGQHDAGSMSYYDFFMQETDLKGLEKIQGLMDMAYNCGWYWAFDEICFVAEKLSALHVNDTNQLHNETGPAIEYRDGTKVYAVDGVVMDEETIMNRSSITVDSIENTESPEQKRIKIQLYGVSNYLNDIKAQIVDMDVIKVNPFDPNSETMPRAVIKDHKDNYFFVGTDGSTQRTYYMNVPNTIKTCVEAHNSISPLPEQFCIAAS